MIVEKKLFKIPSFKFENGEELPIQMGYETFGRLNEDKSNAILVVHYFSASSHCAGKYSEDDEIPGFWDSIIGPGKAVDTDKYFVICSDNICNCGFYNPNIKTTGPASINPKTGKAYALSFPVPTVLDVVNSQKLLLESLGITHLHAVMGPSFGGMASYQWAVSYPHFMDKIIPVISTPILPVYGGFAPLQHGIRAAMLDPKWAQGNYYEEEEKPYESLHLAVQMMNVAAFYPAFYEKTYTRNSEESPADICSMADFEKKLYDVVSLSIKFVDLNHWLYTSKMCMNYDLSRYFDGDVDKMLKAIKAQVLAIPCVQDSLHPACLVKPYIDRLNELGGYGECFVIESEKGHMAGILDTHLFADKIRSFLQQN